MTSERDAAVRRERAERDEFASQVSTLRVKVDNREAALRAVSEQRDALIAERDKFGSDKNELVRDLDARLLLERDENMGLNAKVRQYEKQRDALNSEKMRLQVSAAAGSCV